MKDEHYIFYGCYSTGFSLSIRLDTMELYLFLIFAVCAVNILDIIKDLLKHHIDHQHWPWFGTQIVTASQLQTTLQLAVKMPSDTTYF